jgi:dipeptidyl aminopeptidase/acylaminoacyl peptidase
MGGNITMKNLVVTDNIKAAVIWAGVVGSYDDILNNWSRAGRWRQSAEHRHQGPSRQGFVEEYGSYEENAEFWNSIDPYSFIEDIDTPVQIHHGTGDTHVPFSFSESFKKVLDENGKVVDFNSYEGADHNLSGGAFIPAINRSVAFFDKYLK